MLIEGKGFSLIEVLVSLLLSGIASLALVQLQVYVEQRSEFAENSATALNIAEHKVEWLRTRGASPLMSSIAVADFDSLTNGTDATTYRPYTVTWLVEGTAIMSSTKLSKITVTVAWLDRLGQSQAVVLTTMLSVYSEFIVN